MLSAPIIASSHCAAESELVTESGNKTTVKRLGAHSVRSFEEIGNPGQIQKRPNVHYVQRQDSYQHIGM